MIKAQILLAALLLGATSAGRAQAPPESIYDAPATQALVERVIRASGTVPPGLEDVRARVSTAMYLTLASDSAVGGDLPVTIDEFVSNVRWNREGVLHQRVLGHRVRMLAPAPYSLGSVLEGPWVVPHLYGSTIRVLSSTIGAGGAARGAPPEAVHPFGERGPEFYRYLAGDTIRIYTQAGSVALVPVTVQPRASTGSRSLRLVVGSFWIDTERAAVARARFGFTEPGGGLIGQTGTFLELENGLWEGRYWLPFRQRRELQVSSSLLGGGVSGRIVNAFEGYELNTGWVPERPERTLLVREAARASDTLFTGWAAVVGADAAAARSSDFDDLRLVITGTTPGASALRLTPYYARGEDLFRYNRVEGPYLGVGARLMPADPLKRRWDLYGTAGWAFTEQAARGELIGRWRTQAPGGPRDLPRYELVGGLYRRLVDARSFHPSFEWSWFYSFSALLAGTDERDYYDARGVEMRAQRLSGPFAASLGARYEQQDTVSRNTTGFLFGTAKRFSPLARFEPGRHAALEADLSYSRGAGAFGLGNGLTTAFGAEQGLADFRFTRVVGLLSFRRAAGPLVLAGRLDAGHVTDGAPPQRLFRFGSMEGLSGFEANEFGGSTAALGRARLLVPLPPRGAEPLARSGPFFLPPPRPAFVLLGEAGWADVSDQLRPELERLGARPTDGVIGSVGAGVSVFEDAISLEYSVPLNVPEGERRAGRWYFGLTRWF